MIEDYHFNQVCMSEKSNSICGGDRFTESQFDISTDLHQGSLSLPSCNNESSLEVDYIDDEFVSPSDRLLFETLQEQGFMPISPANFGGEEANTFE